jgi:glycosyltransferase involved in cell wall biosynthesis
MKKKVIFLGGVFNKNKNSMWGGTVATSEYFKASFEGEDYISFVDRSEIKTGKEYSLEKIKNKIKDYDIIHVDENSLAQIFYLNNLKVDVIGPITRSPDTVKEYKMEDGTIWKSVYTSDWFYSKSIIRLNANEEKNDIYLKKVKYIDHAVPTNILLPNFSKQKKYILWAADDKRYAKNIELGEEIKKITTLPSGYEWKFLKRYNINDYIEILDETAILINTSRYESFCSALFEAKSKGVPTIYKSKLHNDRFLDGRIQVEYNAEAYKDKILELLSNKKMLKEEGNLSRKYAEDNASLKKMKESILKIYRNI